MAAEDLSTEQLQAIASGAPADPTAAMSNGQLQAIIDAENAQHAAAATHGPTAPKGTTLEQDLGRTAGLTARAGAEAVGGLPLLPADAGVAVGNLISGNIPLHDSQGRFNWRMQPGPDALPLPGQKFEQGLNAAGLPEPHGAGEVIPSAGISMLAGGRLPAGEPGGFGVTPAQAPAGFVPPAQMKAQVLAQMLKKSQDLGLQVPPSTTNPTMRNVVTETIAGKQNVQQRAAINNDARRTEIAATSVGLNPQAPMTKGAVEAVMEEAGKTFEAGKTVPSFKTDDQFLTDLANVEHEHIGANAAYPGSANPDISKLVNTYTVPSSDGPSSVAAMRQLRAEANDAFRQGNSDVGRAKKGVADAIQAQLERAATANGQPDVVQNLVAGRKLYARAATVLETMSPDGTIKGPELVKAARNNPIDGDLKTAADFAENYPKANYPSAKQGSPVSHLGLIGALGGAGAGGVLAEHLPGLVSGNPGTALAAGLGLTAYPAARNIARRMVLSPSGQARAIPDAAAAARSSMTPTQLAAGLRAFQ